MLLLEYHRDYRLDYVFGANVGDDYRITTYRQLITLHYLTFLRDMRIMEAALGGIERQLSSGITVAP